MGRRRGSGQGAGSRRGLAAGASRVPGSRRAGSVPALPTLGAPGSAPRRGLRTFEGGRSSTAELAGDARVAGPHSRTRAAPSHAGGVRSALGPPRTRGRRRHQERGETIPEPRVPSPACRSPSARWGGRSTWGRGLVSGPGTAPSLRRLPPPPPSPGRRPTGSAPLGERVTH